MISVIIFLFFIVDINKHKRQLFIYTEKVNVNVELSCKALKSTTVWECVLDSKYINDAYELFLTIFKDKLDENMPLTKIK